METHTSKSEKLRCQSAKCCIHMHRQGLIWLLSIHLVRMNQHWSSLGLRYPFQQGTTVYQLLFLCWPEATYKGVSLASSTKGPEPIMTGNLEQCANRKVKDHIPVTPGKQRVKEVGEVINSQIPPPLMMHFLQEGPTTSRSQICPTMQMSADVIITCVSPLGAILIQAAAAFSHNRST